MNVRMKMMQPAEEAGEDEDYGMEEEEATPHVAAPPAKKKARTPAEAVRMKREQTTPIT